MPLSSYASAIPAVSTFDLHNGAYSHVPPTSLQQRSDAISGGGGGGWKPSSSRSGMSHALHGHGHSSHSRTRSLSEALQRGRARASSVSAHEVAVALKAPVSYKLVVLCLIWYASSAFSNTSSKSILNAFPQPVTLTIIQFAFVSSWCVTLSVLARFSPTLARMIPGLAGGLRYPTRTVIKTTAPLAFFQVGGHIASSIATNKIPVSLVHTIKGMSPLFTVAAYRFLFHIHYSIGTYLSLVPLTVGVMLACSAEFRGNLFGIIMAFAGAVIFVSQNIFSKKLFNESSSTAADPSVPLHMRKLDKLNLLCYSSGLAFMLTLPLWLYSEGFGVVGEYMRDGRIQLVEKEGKHGEAPLTGWGLVGEFVFNGTVHFGQNIIAFVLLSLVSPVTYSVASLIKRVFVIIVAIVWFGQSTTGVQAVGIALTFLGLYLYDRAGDAARGEKLARAQQLQNVPPLLPLSKLDTEQSPVGTNYAHAYTESPLSARLSPQPSHAMAENGHVNHGLGINTSGMNGSWHRPREGTVEG